MAATEKRSRLSRTIGSFFDLRECCKHFQKHFWLPECSIKREFDVRIREFDVRNSFTDIGMDSLARCLQAALSACAQAPCQHAHKHLVLLHDGCKPLGKVLPPRRGNGFLTSNSRYQRHSVGDKEPHSVVKFMLKMKNPAGERERMISSLAWQDFSSLNFRLYSTCTFTTSPLEKRTR